MISERSFAQSFDSFWEELLPLLNPRFVSLFNEAYEIGLSNRLGQPLTFLPVAKGIERPDMVAESAFRLARLAHARALTDGQMRGEEALQLAAEKEALELIQRYAGGQPAEIIPLTEVERTDAFRLFERYGALYAAFPGNQKIEFCPKIAGAGFLNSSEGDIGIGNSLIEVKTTTRKPAAKDLRQLITYAALDRHAGRNRWSHVCIFNPRRGALHRVETDTLILRISGGRSPSDVFGDLIAFAESNEPTIEREF